MNYPLLFLALVALACGAALEKKETKNLDEEKQELMNKDDMKMMLKKNHLDIWKMVMDEKYEETFDKYFMKDAKYLLPCGKTMEGKLEMIKHFKWVVNHTMEMGEDYLKDMELEWKSKDLLMAEEFLVDHSLMCVKLPALPTEKKYDHELRMMTVWKLDEDNKWKIYMDAMFGDWLDHDKAKKDDME